MRRVGDAIIVSPSEHVRLVGSVALASWGDVRVRTASARQEALRMLAGQAPGLVIVDCDMPDAMVVAAACFHASVPFLTVNDDMGVASSGGALACISRPFNAARLVDALDVTVGVGTRS